MAYNTFTMLSNHHCYLVPAHFIISKGKPYICQALSPYLTLPPASGNHFLFLYRQGFAQYLAQSKCFMNVY